MSYEQHPLAKKYLPEPKPEDIATVKASIDEYGFDPRYPIFRYEDKILVGWTRYLASRQAKVTPTYVDYGGDEPIAFMMRSEIPRRMLSVVQRLRLMEGLRPALEEEAKNREKSGKPTLPSKDGRVGRVAAIIAEAAGVSEKTAERFHAIEANGTPALQAAVADEVVTIADAAKVVKEPAEKQNAAVNKVRNGKAKTASAAVREPGGDSDAEGERKVSDHFKAELPDGLHAIFETVPEFRSAMAAIAKIRTAVEDIGKSKGKRWLDAQETDRLLNQAHANLRFAMPYTECVKCRRKIQKDCKHCRGGGWLNETTFKACASEADKAWLDKRGDK